MCFEAYFESFLESQMLVKTTKLFQDFYTTNNQFYLLAFVEHTILRFTPTIKRANSNKTEKMADLNHVITTIIIIIIFVFIII